MPVDVLYVEKRAEILVEVRVLNLSDMTAFFLAVSIRIKCTEPLCQLSEGDLGHVGANPLCIGNQVT